MLAINSLFLGLVPLIFLLTIPHGFSKGFRSGELAGQSSTMMAWASNQVVLLMAVWVGLGPADERFQMKDLKSPYRSSEGNM